MYHFPNTPSVTASLPLFREFSVTFPVEQIPNSLKDRSGLTISWPSFPIASSSIPLSQSILLPTWHYHHSFHDPLYKLLFHPLPNPVASCKLLCILQNTAKCNFLSNSIFFPPFPAAQFIDTYSEFPQQLIHWIVISFPVPAIPQEWSCVIFIFLTSSAWHSTWHRQLLWGLEKISEGKHIQHDEWITQR